NPEPTPAPIQITLAALAFDENHALAYPGDSLTIRYVLSAPAPSAGLTLTVRAVDWDVGVTYPSAVSVAPATSEGTFTIVRGDELMVARQYSLASSVTGDVAERILIFTVET
ncbi:MAG TPA: hypothetical protein VF114_04920, partial [Candidatus Limnocylindria bacterium]